MGAFCPELTLNLENLTREQKLQLLDLIEEKKRRERERKAVYVPNAGQTPVHESQSSLRVVFSGNGAGKTAMATNEALWLAQGYNAVTQSFTPVPARVIVLLDHPDKVQDVWLPELRKWANIPEDYLDKRGKHHVNLIRFPNGSEIIFMFHQQEPLIFESIELDAVIADEPPPRHIFIALRRGARKQGRKAKFVIVGTPIMGSWMRQQIYEPWQKGELKDTECFRFDTRVNEANLSEGYIEEFSRLLSEKERRIRLHGEFHDLEGLALAHLFDRQIHLVDPFEWSEDAPCVVAIDPHPEKPHYACLLGSDKEGYLYYIKEISLRAVPRDFARSLKEWYAGYRVVDFVSDSLGSADGTGGEGFKSFIQVLNEEGIRVRATTWTDKNDDDFISRIQDALAIPDKENNFGQKIPKLRIFKNCHGVVSNIENVQWVKYRNLDEYKPKLDITNKDFLSCLKYGLATNISYNKGQGTIYRPVFAPQTYGVRPTPQQKRAKILKLGFKRK